MTTKQFLVKNLAKTNQMEKRCSSVVIRNGVAYSYGEHYPLATIIDGKGFVNDRGYSASTSKHIGWAKSALSELVSYGNVYGIKLQAGKYYGTGQKFNKADMLSAIEAEINDIQTKMATKKRKDTQVYAWLNYDLSQAEVAREAVRSINE